MRHAYGSHRDQYAELTLPAIPAEEGPFPVAVLVHGGGWSAGYDWTLMARLAQDLAARGWAAWNLEFRRVGPASGGGWPHTGADVLAGIDALAALDAPLDLARVVVIGHSSGGQLALWAASQRSGEGVPVRVRAVVGQAPVSDLEAHHSGVVAAFIGADPAAYAEASPLRRLPLGLPQLLVHGEADPVVPAAMSRAYTERARAAGDHVTLVLRSADGHNVHLDPGSVAWAAVVQWLEPWGP
ncbi:MAG TPA: alpha/beta fold hydrolase [Solirubrobacteraceae bacterium]